MKKIHIFQTVFLMLFFTNCVSYNNTSVDISTIVKVENKKIGYSIHTTFIRGRKLIHKSFTNILTQFNYKARFYDINNEMDINTDYERYYKITRPELMYSEEDTQIHIYCATKYSEFDNCYSTVSSCSLYLIPYISNDDVQVVIDISKMNKFVKRYAYTLNVDSYYQILLAPALYFDPIDEKSEKAFEIVFQKFLLDAQKDKLL